MRTCQHTPYIPRLVLPDRAGQRQGACVCVWWTQTRSRREIKDKMPANQRPSYAPAIPQAPTSCPTRPSRPTPAPSSTPPPTPPVTPWSMGIWKSHGCLMGIAPAPIISRWTGSSSLVEYRAPGSSPKVHSALAPSLGYIHSRLIGGRAPLVLAGRSGLTRSGKVLPREAWDSTMRRCRPWLGSPQGARYAAWTDRPT